MKIKPTAVAAVMVLGAAVLGACGGSNSNNAPAVQKFSAVVYGDMPYSLAVTGQTSTALTEFDAMPDFIKTINADKDVSFAMHVGDIHSGSEPCTETYDRAIDMFEQSLAIPLVYTPGDNEWEDCQIPKSVKGTYTESNPLLGNTAGVVQPTYSNSNPLDNLTLLRQIFFPTVAKPLGNGGTLVLHSQAVEGTSDIDKQYVENVWWMNQGVLFVTANIPGGSNNGTDVWYSNAKPSAPDWADMTAQQSTEVANRSTATRDWLNNAFTQAQAQHATAIVIVEQADLWAPEAGPHPPHQSEYKQYIDVIAAGATKFGKPVLLFNGDTHNFESDNPLMPGQACIREDLSQPQLGAQPCGQYDPYGQNAAGATYNVPNFHRVMTHGQALPMEWLKLTFDPATNAPNGVNAFGPFSWQRQIQAQLTPTAVN